MDLNANNLFALIALKNIFPYEFDLLQEDRGFIRSVFDKLEIERTILINKYLTKIENIKDEIVFTNNKVVDDKFELIATMISADVSLYYANNGPWADYLKRWSENPDKTTHIRYSGGSSGYFRYNEFIDNFVLNTEKKKIIERFPNSKETELNRLYSEIEKLKLNIKDAGIYKYKKIISELSSDRIDELFYIEDNNKITQSHYFSLIRYLIVEGLIDETYWYYKGNFDIDKSKALKRNDMLYMKNLLEAKKQDVFLDIETPLAIIKRLNLNDFSRFNILNKNILETCIKESLDENVIIITDSVDVNDEYVELVKIINCFDIEITEKYISIILESNVEKIVEILDACNGEYDNTFKNILISLLTNESISSDKLKLFSNYIEENENIISEIPEDKFDLFINNISVSNIKFNSLTECDISINRLKCIEKSQSYYLSVNNVIYVAKRLSGKEIYYSNLISEVYQSKLLESTKEYIEDHFVDFVHDYITSNAIDGSYCDSEEIVIKILTSNLSEDYKIKYVNKNDTIITDITLLGNILENEFVDVLFNKDIIKFTKENVSNFWNSIDNYNNAFVQYVDRNITEDNAENILSINEELCNILINDHEISDKLFDFIVKYVNNPIEKISPNLSLNRVKVLIENRLIKYNKYNTELLFNKNYCNELVLYVNLCDEEEQNKCVEVLLDLEIGDEMVYMLINSNLSDKNAMKLFDLINGNVQINKIDIDRDVIIKKLLNERLLNDNIEYIIENFEIFKFKDEFILNLIYNSMLCTLDYTYLTDSFIKYVLNSDSVCLDYKIELFENIINSGVETEWIKTYLQYINEISDLSYVFDGRYPPLNNEYKIKIANILNEKKIIKVRKDNKIMLR